MGQCQCCDSRGQGEIVQDTSNDISNINDNTNITGQKNNQDNDFEQVYVTKFQKKQKKINYEPSQEQIHLPTKQVGQKCQFSKMMQKRSDAVKRVMNDSDINYDTQNLTPYFLDRENDIIAKQNKFPDGDLFQTIEFKQKKDFYSGFWTYQKMHGYGVYVWADGSIYQGHWKNDQASGHGQIIYTDGSQYIGFWSNDKMNGKGKYIDKDNKKIYIGEWQDDSQHGQGIETFTNSQGQQNQYKGQFVKGQKTGMGSFSWHDGSIYEGEFKNNLMDGDGTYTWPDRRKYIGKWKLGKMNGQGQFIWQDGRQYQGNFLNDLKHGYGTFRWPDGRQYIGHWHEGKQNGKGTFIREKKIIVKEIDDGKEVENIEIQTEKKNGIWKDGKFEKWEDDNSEFGDNNQKNNDDTIVKDE